MNFGDKVTYAYIKNVKRWMECPVCHEKMTFKKKKRAWVCDACSYIITEKEFLDDFVLWFCDECGAYLNVQDGFNRKGEKHICQNCGYENDTTLNNIKGTCIDCGSKLENPDANLCDECKQARKKKAKEWMIIAGKWVGITATAIGAAYVATLETDDEEGSENDINKFNHSRRWFEKATLEEIQDERNKVQADYLNPDLDIDYRGKLWDLFPKYDNAISEKQWDGKEPGYPIHREHGWYLSNDD